MVCMVAVRSLVTQLLDTQSRRDVRVLERFTVVCRKLLRPHMIALSYGLASVSAVLLVLTHGCMWTCVVSSNSATMPTTATAPTPTQDPAVGRRESLGHYERLPLRSVIKGVCQS